MSVFSHTHMCVSERSSEALFCASVQKRRNLRVDTSPTVLNRISLHHLSSSTCLKASRSLPRKKKITVFFLAGGRGSSAESHLPPNFELHCAGSGPHQSTSFELLCPSEAFPKRAVANSFLVSTCIFDSARQSVQNQRCLQSRGLSTAEGHIRLNSSPPREGFKRPEELNPCRLLQFRARGIANSVDSALFHATAAQNQKIQVDTRKLLATGRFGKASDGQRSSNDVD